MAFEQWSLAGAASDTPIAEHTKRKVRRKGELEFMRSIRIQKMGICFLVNELCLKQRQK
jgi:hypothetical protein